MDADARMPGYLEAKAAADGMFEIYGCELPSVGDRVSFRLRSHGEAEYEAGRVVRHMTDDGRPIIVVEVDGGDGTVRALDAREWPLGNILPF